MLRVAISDSPAVFSDTGAIAPCVAEARRVLEMSGLDVEVFLATGTGGGAMEFAIGNGLVAGVLDLALTELADELFGGSQSAGPDRLTAAALHGVPQVVVPGALDMMSFAPAEPVAERYRGRLFYRCDSGRILLRMNAEESDQLGREVALKVSAARGPAAVLLPLRGLSTLDREGQPFWRPEADAALFQSVRNWISPHVGLLELDRHINDLELARTAAAVLLEMLEKCS